MQKVSEPIYDEVDWDAVEGLDQAVQIDPWFEMPRGVYADERAFYFEQLARTHEIREVELRVGLSNIFCAMMARNSLRRDR